MRHWTQLVLLALAAVVCLGTSKQLFGKKLITPKIQAPPGLTVVGEPKAALKEGVNNQGCFARQLVDFSLRAEIRNDTGKALKVHSDWIHGILGFEKSQEKFRVDRVRILVLDAHKKQVGDGKTLAPGAQGALLLHALSILPKKRLKDVRWVRLSADLQGALLVVEYRNVGQLKTESMR